MDSADVFLGTGGAITTFKHSPLAQSRVEIRLIQILPGLCEEPIRCELRHFPIPKAGYVALSYEWGSSEKTHYIDINASPFYVTRNFHDFLSAARKSIGDTWLWVDAICIDQTNIPERNDQVKRMGKIYSVAKQDKHWIQELNQALIQICNHGYWSRLWVSQEFLEAQLIGIWIGEDHFEGKHFYAFITEVVLNEQLMPSVCKKILESAARALCELRWLLPREIARLRSGLTGSLQLPLEEVLLEHCFKGCSDWHDNVYGILSLVQGGDRFPVQYSSNKVDLILAVIQLHDLREMTWTVAHVLTEVLDIPDTALLRSSGKEYIDDVMKEWKTLSLSSMYAVLVAEKVSEPRLDTFLPSPPRPPSSAAPGTIYLVAQRRFHDKNTSTAPSEFYKLAPLMLGGELYNIETVGSVHGYPLPSLNRYLVFRPSPHTKCGYQFLGAVRSGLGYSLHASPELDAPYSLEDHLSRDPEDKTRLLLHLDPPTLCFIIRTLIRTQRLTIAVTRQFMNVAKDYCQKGGAVG
ncbi:MAG: hypothetical protein Q9226_000983 [Calogaya cf. arnoldii]